MSAQSHINRTYPRSYYVPNVRDKFRHFALADVFAEVLNHRACSVLDVGCGAALFVLRLRQLGFDARGIDASAGAIASAEEDLIQRGLVQQANLTTYEPDEVYDAVICTEVAEHLPEQYADTLVSLIRKMEPSTIIWSAASPGQGGTDHVNLKPPWYWLDKFKPTWKVDRERTAHLREGARLRQTVHSEYINNFYVLVRCES